MGNNALLEMIARKHKDANLAIERVNCHTFSDEFGATLLHYSAEYGNEDVTKYLLEKRCDVNVRDALGNTPLMKAVTRKHVAVVKLLLLAEADISILNNENKSALHMVFTEHEVPIDILILFLATLKKQSSTSEEKAKILIDAGCHLYQAAYLKDAAVIEYMLQCSLPVYSRRPKDNQTTLHLAVLLSDLNTVKVLLKYGADANACDNKGATPLCDLYLLNSETTREKLEIMHMLSNSGVCLTQCNSAGYFYIGTTLVKGDQEVIRVLLLSNLINFTTKDEASEWTALHYLVLNTNPGVVEELKIHVNKFDVNATDKTGESPLFSCVKEGNIPMVKFLLEAGADPNWQHGICRFPPLLFAYLGSKLASEDQYDQCFELLLQHKADPPVYHLS